MESEWSLWDLIVIFSMGSSIPSDSLVSITLLEWMSIMCWNACYWHHLWNNGHKRLIMKYYRGAHFSYSSLFITHRVCTDHNVKPLEVIFRIMYLRLAIIHHTQHVILPNIILNQWSFYGILLHRLFIIHNTLSVIAEHNIGPSNPSNAVATFAQSTRMQRCFKTIKILSCWYS